MEQETKKCPKCGGEMERGVLSPQDNRFWIDDPNFVEKVTELRKNRKGVLGRFSSPPSSFKVIRAQSCVRCGYIEFFVERK